MYKNWISSSKKDAWNSVQDETLAFKPVHDTY